MNTITAGYTKNLTVPARAHQRPIGGFRLSLNLRRGDVQRTRWRRSGNHRAVDGAAALDGWLQGRSAKWWGEGVQAWVAHTRSLKNLGMNPDSGLR